MVYQNNQIFVVYGKLCPCVWNISFLQWNLGFKLQKGQNWPNWKIISFLFLWTFFNHGGYENLGKKMDLTIEHVLLSFYKKQNR